MKIVKWIFVFLLLAFVNDCSVMKSSDLRNPCYTGDKLDCAKWKNAYPKEYERYQKRMNKYRDLKDLPKSN